MPRNVDPGTILVGKGLAPDGTVEDSSLRYPERDVDPLRVHLHDPSRAHMASTIGIVDAGDCFISDEVEGALQEICSGGSAGRLNGLIAGGTFVETFPHVGLTLTLVTATEILVNTGVFTASGLTVTLPAVDDTYFIYFDTDSSSPGYQTLQYTTTAPPEIETATEIEDVMIAKVEVQTGGTETDAYQDARFFVRNLDRKVQYSSRQGENVDAWSEGCFATLDAFMFWMTYYGSSFGTGEEQKGEVLVRGTHSLTSTLTIPMDNLQFVGDGNAIIETSGAGFASPMIQLGSGLGSVGVLFRNITFNANVAGITAILASGAAKLSRLRIEDCDFTQSGIEFDTCIDLSTPGGSGFDVRITGCTINHTNIGVNIDGLKDVWVSECRIRGQSASVVGSIGVNVGLTTVCNNVSITDSRIENSEVGVALNRTSTANVSNNKIFDVAYGVVQNQGGGGAGSDYNIHDNTITLDDTNGEKGVTLLGTGPFTIHGNHIKCPRTTGFASDPLGVEVSNASQDVKITDNTIDGFYDQAADLGASIKVYGTPGTQQRNAVISGNILKEAGIALSEDLTGFVVSGNTLDGLYGQTAGDYNTLAAISITASAGGVPKRGVVSGNTIHRFGDGILVEGLDTANACRDITISDNVISQIAHIQDNQLDTFDAIGTKGIGLQLCAGCSVAGNRLAEMGFVLNDSDVNISTGAGNIWTLPVYVRNSGNIVVSTNQIIQPQSDGILGKSYGIVFGIIGTGAAFTGAGYEVLGNSIVHNDLVHPTTHSAIWFNAGDSAFLHSTNNAKVSENIIGLASIAARMTYGIAFTDTELSSGAAVGGTYLGVVVSNNKVSGFDERGISFDVGDSASQVFPALLTDCHVLNNTLSGYMGDETNRQIGTLLQATATAAVASMIGNEVKGNLIKGRDQGIKAAITGTLASVFGRNSITDNIVPTLVSTIVDTEAVVVDRTGDHSAQVRDDDLVISRNQIGLGTTTGAAPDYAIRIDLGDHAFSGLVLDNNTTNTGVDANRSIEIVNSASVLRAISDVSICGNDVRSATVTSNFGLWIQLVEATLNRVKINGNALQATSSGGGTNEGLLFRVTNATAVGLLTSVSISDNTVSNGVLSLDLDGVGLLGVDISNNLVAGPVGTPLVDRGCIEVLLENAAAFVALPCISTSVNGNQVSNACYGIRWDAGRITSQRDTQITGNQITSPSATIAPLGGDGIYYASRVDTSDLINTQINDNQISNFQDGNGIKVFVNIPNGLEVNAFSVSRNQLTGPHSTTTDVYAAIDVDINSTAPAALSGIYIEDNIIDGDSIIGYPQNGVNVVFPSNAGHNIANISVSDNKVFTNVPDAGTGRGIDLHFPCVVGGPGDPVQPYTVLNLTVDRNQMALSGGAVAHASGVELELSCFVNNMSASGNTIRGRFGNSYGNHGLRLYHLFVAANAQEGDVANTYLVGTENGVTAPNIWWDNTVNPTTPFRAVNWSNLNLSDNTITFNAGYSGSVLTPGEYRSAMSIGHVRETTITLRVVVPVWGCVISGNTLRAVKDTVANATGFFIGFQTRTETSTARWPNGAAPLGAFEWFQSGWVITGNNATRFATEDGTAPGTFYGQCVKNNGSTIVGAGSGICATNLAADSGVGAGWDEILAGTNLNNSPRTF